jgi:hypothetical protein
MRTLPTSPCGLRRAGAAGLCAGLLFLASQAAAADPACKTPAWVAHVMFSPPEPIATRRTVLSDSQVAAIVKAGPQPAPDDMVDSANHPTAEAYLFPEDQVTIAFYIGGCARHRLDMNLTDFLGIIAGAAGQGT